MRVALALTQRPLLEGGAPGKCAVGLIRGLLAHGVELRALANVHPLSVPGTVPGDLPVELVSGSIEPSSWRSRLRRLRRPRGELGRGEFGARFRELAADCELVHLEETEAGWADEGLSLPSLVHIHYLVRRDRGLGRPWSPAGRDTIELELAERAAIRRHRYLVASSPLIAAELRRRVPQAEVVLAPLSLDPDHYRPAPLDGPPLAGVIGTAAWLPTAAAMRRLVTGIWPLVRKRLPEARLLVAGRGTQALGLPAGDGVEILGEVDSAGELFQRLSVLCYPLERGSGMKVKVLEAIASGVPVVTTEAGAEGIEPNDGVAVESDDEALARATVQLLRDEPERRQRGAAARATFELRYSPAPATTPLVELYRLMLDR
jgi:glycosyltransferase involved in cell wall biosynthesis